MTKKVTLNPWNEVAIREAGTREKADAHLELLLASVSRKMADAIRTRSTFNGSPNEVAYFRYLKSVRHLISRTYPKRKRA